MSSRVSDAQRTLQAVQERNAEVLKIEQAMTELAMLFQDLETMIMQQDTVINQVVKQSEAVNEHLTQANEDVEKGAQHAARARRNKWWCILIVCIIIAAIALGVGLGIYFNRPK
jgi:syntaxin 1B/2/3